MYGTSRISSQGSKYGSTQFLKHYSTWLKIEANGNPAAMFLHNPKKCDEFSKLRVFVGRIFTELCLLPYTILVHLFCVLPHSLLSGS